MQLKEVGRQWEGGGSGLLSPRGLFSATPPPRGLIAAWGKGLGQLALGTEMVSVPGVSSASVPLWLLGVEAGWGGTEARGVSPGLAACWQVQLPGVEDTKRFGAREAKTCAGQFQGKLGFLSFQGGLLSSP